jgi:hypothetical protein
LGRVVNRAGAAGPCESPADCQSARHCNQAAYCESARHCNQAAYCESARQCQWTADCELVGKLLQSYADPGRFSTKSDLRTLAPSVEGECQCCNRAVIDEFQPMIGLSCSPLAANSMP